MAQAPVLLCDVCEKKESVKWYCVTCSETLCDNCKFIHTKNRKTKNDKIILLSETSNQNLKQSPELFCTNHNTEEQNIYCESCNVTACMICVHKEHKKHNWITIDEYKISKREELKDGIKTSLEKISALGNALDSEHKLHDKFILHLEETEAEIKTHTAKVIEKILFLEKDQLSQLAALIEEENKRHFNVCSLLQTNCDELRTLVTSIETGLENDDIQSLRHLQQNIKDTLEMKREESHTVQMRTCRFQQGTLESTALQQIQGTLISESDGTILYGPDTQRTMNTNHIKASSQIMVHGNQERLHVVVPVDNNAIWVAVLRDRRLTLISKNGEILKKSVDVGGEIADAAQYDDDLLIAQFDGHRIVRLSSDGATSSSFADVTPSYTMCLCVTSDNYVLVCVTSKHSLNHNQDDNQAKIVKIGEEGNIIQTIQYGSGGSPLLRWPVSITSILTGEIIVVDLGSQRSVVCIDKNERSLWKWRGKIAGEKDSNFNPQRIAYDNFKKLYLTDYNDKIFVIQTDAKNPRCVIDQSDGIFMPSGIAFNATGDLMIGAASRKLHLVDLKDLLMLG